MTSAYALQAGEKQALHQTILELRIQHDLPGLDLSLFMLDSERQMSGDDSVVFYNNTASPGGGVLVHFSEREARFSLDLTRLGQVERLILTASHDEWPLKRAGLLRAEVAELAFDPLPGFHNEKAAMLLEIYRHKGAWKVGAIGQGFAGGLADLINYFGGEVEETPAPSAPPSPIPSASTASTARVSLVKVVSLSQPISLVKGERVSLRKEDGAPELSQVCMGLGWDAATGKGNIDLDAGCLLFDDMFKHLETVFFMRLNSSNKSVRHSGDNLTGEGEGDDEVIEVDLTQIPARAAHLVFVVNSFSGHNFSDVKQAFCRLFIAGTRHELARFDLSGGKPVTGMLMCRLSRSLDPNHPGGWHMTALGIPAPGMTARGSIKRAQEELREMGR